MRSEAGMVVDYGVYLENNKIAKLLCGHSFSESNL
jgi:hypothetical protein